MKKNILRNQKGFTLIEIIAVLVILGILAAVAIPKYLDLQAEAKLKSVEGALAAGASNASMMFSQGLLADSGTAPTMTSLQASLNGDVKYTYTGDFQISYAVGTNPTGCTGGSIAVTYVAGPPNGTNTTYLATGVAPTKTFCMY